MSSGADSIDHPTDTGITLEDGLWRDGKLSKKEGWRLYHFKPKKAGYYEFTMRAAPELAGSHGGLWTYLRIIDTDPENKNPSSVNEVWVTVADNKTNLTAVLVNCRANVEYQVIATTQNNSTANDLEQAQRQRGRLHGLGLCHRLHVRRQLIMRTAFGLVGSLALFGATAIGGLVACTCAGRRGWRERVRECHRGDGRCRSDERCLDPLSACPDESRIRSRISDDRLQRPRWRASSAGRLRERHG